MSGSLNLNRFSYLTLDDIYHPALDTVVHLILSLITILNTVLLPIMIYIIVKYSTKEMKQYKHLLIIQILFSYLFDLITFAWQPSLLWPLRQGFPNTWIRIGSITVYVFFILEVSFMFNIVVVQFYLLLYRLAATYKYSWLQYIYGNIKVLYISFFITILVFQVTTITPIIYDGTHPEEVRRLTASDLPVMAKLIEIQPSIAGYHPALAKGGIDFLLLLGVVIICLLPGIVIASLVFFSYRLRSLVVQIILLVSFLLLPAEIFILTIYFELSWGSYAAAGCVVVCSFHMASDSLALLYFIKPYRLAIRKKLRHFLRPLSHAVGPISTNNQHVLPSLYGRLYH